MNQTVWPTGTRRNGNGEIEIDGVPLTTLAEEHGTPLYVLSERELRDNCRAFRRSFTDLWSRTRVVYAGKAGINGALLRIIQEEGLSLDVVSGGELAMALAAGFNPEEISFHGNNKGPGELQEALEAGVGKIVIDNLDEVGRLADVAAALGKPAQILLRLNPGVDVHTHRKISTGIVDSKFGFPIRNGQAAEAVTRILARPELDLLGYHAHIGSQLFEPVAYIAAIEELVAFAASIRDMHGIEMQHLSPGGGFGIAYLDQQEPKEAAYWARIITDSVRVACQRFGLAEPVLTIEPGRSIVGPAGVALYRVGSIKEIPGVRTYVAVDGGMADNIRPSLYDAEYTAAIANRNETGPGRDVAIVGKYCESGDILIEKIALPDVAVGDLLAVPGCGAYCLPMASNYNGSLRPAVLLLNDGDVKIMRHRETYRDLFRHDPILDAWSKRSPT
ncbi:MAG: diaminopimelate decarboxylase [Chloroflexia bacterium]|nr:diaminopimelate decarboxylase [Chloroflexia bacterium]